MTKTRIHVDQVMAGDHPVFIGEHALLALDRSLANEHRQAARFILGDDNTLRQCLPELLAL